MLFTEEDVIHRYTRKQAIDDGVLVDLSALEPELCKEHYKYPIACTATVFALIKKAVENKKYCNDYKGVIHDLLWMSRCYSRPGTNVVHFPCIITGAGRKRNYMFKMVIGPGDTDDPVLTLMFPEED